MKYIISSNMVLNTWLLEDLASHRSKYLLLHSPYYLHMYPYYYDL